MTLGAQTGKKKPFRGNRNRPEFFIAMSTEMDLNLRRFSNHKQSLSSFFFALGFLMNTEVLREGGVFNFEGRESPKIS